MLFTVLNNTTHVILLCYNERKKDIQKLMNKYLVSWTLLFPEKKVFLIWARSARRVAVCGRSGPARPSQPSVPAAAGAGPAR